MRMLEDRQVVVEINNPDMPPVKAGGPERVAWVHGIVDVVKKLRINHIPGVRIGVRSAERQVLPRGGPEGALQPSVVGVAFVFDQIDAGKAYILPIVVGICTGGAATSAAANVLAVSQIARRQGIDVLCL